MLSDVTQLREGLLTGKWTSVDLVNVFAKRCYQIGRALCLTCEEDFEYGLAQAEIKDRERAEALKNETELPLLHGIPVSVKELNEQKGKLVTVGCEHLCEQIFAEDNPTIKLIKDAGAIIIVRGNVPQVSTLDCKLSLARIFYSLREQCVGCCQEPPRPNSFMRR